MFRGYNLSSSPSSTVQSVKGQLTVITTLRVQEHCLKVDLTHGPWSNSYFFQYLTTCTYNTAFLLSGFTQSTIYSKCRGKTKRDDGATAMDVSGN